LLLSPQTIGPFEAAAYRRLAGAVMTRAAAVVVRDPESMAAVVEIAPGARTVQSVDVAFALPYDDKRGERGGPRLRVGLNVSGLLDHEARSGRNRFGLQADYAQLMERLLATLVARRDIEPHLIAHVAGDRDGPDNDEPVARRLAKRFPTVVLAPRFAGPREAKTYISSLDFLVAARMHACIAAFSAGVPVLPVAYSRKFSGLFGMLDYRWMVPVTGMNTDEALAFALACLDRRADLAAGVAAGMGKVSALLDCYRAELRGFLLEAAR
jgi:polysaccharide pyruvyl transferase WcaK-like protein